MNSVKYFKTFLNMSENIDQIHNNFYSILLRMYNNNNMESEKRNQIPCILAVISLVLNDRNKVDEVINNLKNYDFNIVFFIPKQRLNFYLKYLKNFFKGREVFIAREMTKLYETFYRGNIDTLNLTDKKLQGEITVILSKKVNKKSEKNNENKDFLLKEIKEYLNRYSLKDVVKLISEKNNLPKKQIYNLCLNIKKNE